MRCDVTSILTTAMCGGALYWNCDISDPNQTWQEVFDYTAAGDVLDPGVTTAGCSGDGAISFTPDNNFTVHAIIVDNQNFDHFSTSRTGTRGVPRLDIPQIQPNTGDAA